MINKHIDISFDKAIRAYTKAHNDLREILRKFPDHLPPGSITCGMIAEYYAKLYLDWKFDGATIQYGCANEKGWDLLLQLDNAEPVRYQVKAASAHNQARKISKIGSQCDRVIVTLLDQDYHLRCAYLIENVHTIPRSDRNRILVAPDRQETRRQGSTIFKEYGREITEEMWDALTI